MTAAAIKRVKEGIAAAGDVYDGLRLRAVRQIIEKTLNRLEAINQGHSEPKARSGLRRFASPLEARDCDLCLAGWCIDYSSCADWNS